MWEVAASTSAAERDVGVGVLSPDERIRADRYHFDKDRDLFVSCRAALRRVLGRRMGQTPADVPLETDAFGKPRVEGVDFHFNVSHAGTRGLVVISRCPVGIDLETLRRIEDAEAIAKRFFTSEEQAAIFRDDDRERIGRRFLMCWTLKEAYLKARGVGLSGSLTDFSVDIDSDPPRVLWAAGAWSDDEAEWSLGFVPTPNGYLGAVAVHSPVWELRPGTDADGLGGD